ncbi:MAG: hypothetical protein V7633_3081, partial [Pseudonocardia sp.]
MISIRQAMRKQLVEVGSETVSHYCQQDS